MTLSFSFWKSIYLSYQPFLIYLSHKAMAIWDALRSPFWIIISTALSNSLYRQWLPRNASFIVKVKCFHMQPYQKGTGKILYSHLKIGAVSKNWSKFELWELPSNCVKRKNKNGSKQKKVLRTQRIQKREGWPNIKEKIKTDCSCTEFLITC